MTDKSLVTRDLVESILELRGEAERRLMQNKYYVVIKKLDELLEAIRPFDAEVIEESAPSGRTNTLTSSRQENDMPLQHRLASAEAATPEGHDWWRESAPSPIPGEPHTEAQPQPAATQQAAMPTAADDDLLTLDERHERPAEPQPHNEDAEFIIEEDKRALQRAEFGI